MQLVCPNCRNRLPITPEQLGQSVVCEKCETTIALPVESLPAGVVIGGDFLIQRALGHGGMGLVYLTHQESLDRPAAMKVLHTNLADDEEFISQFVREARAAAKLNHPNVVQAYAVGEDSGLYYFAMEYIDGESVKQILKREGKIAPVRAAEIIRDIASALGYAWKTRKIVHQDIKPDNIMLTESGVAKLADLGLARIAGEGHPDDTDTEEVLGTPQYISPEQLTGVPTDVRSDLYSLGATFYHMVTGRFPYRGKSASEITRQHLDGKLIPPEQVNTEVPEFLSKIIVRMMQRNIHERFQTPEELITELNKFLDNKALTSAIRINLHTPDRPGNAKIKIGNEPETSEPSAPKPAPKPAAAPAATGGTKIRIGVGVNQKPEESKAPSPPPAAKPEAESKPAATGGIKIRIGVGSSAPEPDRAAAEAEEKPAPNPAATKAPVVGARLAVGVPARKSAAAAPAAETAPASETGEAAPEAPAAKPEISLKKPTPKPTAAPEPAAAEAATGPETPAAKRGLSLKKPAPQPGAEPAAGSAPILQPDTPPDEGRWQKLRRCLSRRPVKRLMLAAVLLLVVLIIAITAIALEKVPTPLRPAADRLARLINHLGPWQLPTAPGPEAPAPEGTTPATGETPAPPPEPATRPEFVHGVESLLEFIRANPEAKAEQLTRIDDFLEQAGRARNTEEREVAEPLLALYARLDEQLQTIPARTAAARAYESALAAEREQRQQEQQRLAAEAAQRKERQEELEAVAEDVESAAQQRTAAERAALKKQLEAREQVLAAQREALFADFLTRVGARDRQGLEQQLEQLAAPLQQPLPGTPAELRKLDEAQLKLIEDLRQAAATLFEIDRKLAQPEQKPLIKSLELSLVKFLFDLNSIQGNEAHVTDLSAHEEKVLPMEHLGLRRILIDRLRRVLNEPHLAFYFAVLNQDFEFNPEPAAPTPFWKERIRPLQEAYFRKIHREADEAKRQELQKRFQRNPLYQEAIK